MSEHNELLRRRQLLRRLGDKTLVERWNGTSWSIVTSPNPSGATFAVLSGVSCPSTTSCYAVGESALDKTLVEHWNGTSWSIVASPNPSGADRLR